MYQSVRTFSFPEKILLKTQLLGLETFFFEMIIHRSVSKSDRTQNKQNNFQTNHLKRKF